MLTVNDIQNAQDSDILIVEVPEWGGEVGIRVMTGKERDAYEASILGDNNRQNLVNIRSRMLVKCLTGDDGKRLFADGQVDILAAKSGAVLSRLFEIAQSHNGMTQDDINQLMGNLNSDQNGDSG